MTFVCVVPDEQAPFDVAVLDPSVCKHVVVVVGADTREKGARSDALARFNTLDMLDELVEALGLAHANKYTDWIA